LTLTVTKWRECLDRAYRFLPVVVIRKASLTESNGICLSHPLGAATQNSLYPGNQTLISQWERTFSQDKDSTDTNAEDIGGGGSRRGYVIGYLLPYPIYQHLVAVDIPIGLHVNTKRLETFLKPTHSNTNGC
jgi:hypothetical protein